MTKDAFDAYLFKDGKPLATTGEVYKRAYTCVIGRVVDCVEFSHCAGRKFGTLEELVDGIVKVGISKSAEFGPPARLRTTLLFLPKTV